MPGTSLITTRRAVLTAMAAVPFAGNVALARSTALDRVMVQGRPQDTGSIYKTANILRALDQLGGVRKMRCREPFAGTPGWRTYVGLARAGVKFCFTLAGREVARSHADLRVFNKEVPGATWAIEFPNEPDLNPITYGGLRDERLGFRIGRAPALMRYIGDMHEVLRADPLLKSIPLIASNDFMQAQQSRFTNLGNSHIYPHQSKNIDEVLAGFARKLAQGGHLQGVITEWGRTTGGGAGNVTAPPVSVNDQAKLLHRDLQSILQKPFVKAVNLYELFSWKGSGEMQNFGLFDNDLSPRPAVAMIRSLLA